MYALHVHLSDLAVHSGGSSVGLDWGHTDRPLCGIAWLSSPWQGIICDDNLQVTDLTFGGPMHVATPLFDPSTLSSMVSIPLMGTLPSELISLSHLVSLQLTRPALQPGHALIMDLETNGFWNDLFKSRLVLGIGTVDVN